MRSPRELAASAAKSILSPFVPARSRLGFAFWLKRLEGSCEPELAHIDELIALSRVAFDVSAGQGFYAYALSKRFERVYAFCNGGADSDLLMRGRPANVELLQIDSARATLDDFKIANVDFIRFAVEGEMKALTGAAATIERCRPMVLIALKRESAREADAWFRRLDYRHCYLQDFNEIHGDPSNHIFVPYERLARFGIARPAE